MPIKTKLVTRLLSLLSCRAQNKTCSTISSAVKFRLKPILPVAQNKQPSGQPAWEETQTVLRPPAWRSKTVSIFKPSLNSNKDFREFLSRLRETSALIFRGQTRFSSWRNGKDRLVALSQSSNKSTKIACLACFNLNFGSLLKIFSNFPKFIKITCSHFLFSKIP